MTIRMHLPLLLVALLSFAAPVPAQTVKTTGLTPAEAAEIVRLAEAGDAYWNDRDAAGLSSLYTEDAHNWMVGGDMNLRGREAIAAFFTGSFARRGPGLRHRTVVTELQLVAPGVVAADGDVFVERVEDGAAPRVLRRFTMNAVAVKEADGWRIRINRVHPQPAEPSTAAAQR